MADIRTNTIGEELEVVELGISSSNAENSKSFIVMRHFRIPELAINLHSTLEHEVNRIRGKDSLKIEEYHFFV